MLYFMVPQKIGEPVRVAIPREVEARGPEALAQHYFALCEAADAGVPIAGAVTEEDDDV